MKTSACANSAIAAAWPSAVFSSRPIERLLADISGRYGDVSMYAAWLRSPAQFDPNSRATSGLVRDSIRSTSAPWYANARPQLGAAMAIESSTTVRPAKTPKMATPRWSCERSPAWHVRVVDSARVVALGPAPAQPALHELIEVAVQHARDVPRLDVG